MQSSVLVERIKEIELLVQESVMNHNGLVGRLMEARELLEKCSCGAVSANECVSDVIDAEVVG